MSHRRGTINLFHERLSRTIHAARGGRAARGGKARGLQVEETASEVEVMVEVGGWGRTVVGRWGLKQVRKRYTRYLLYTV
jgi:hypothetical protein